MSCPIAVDHVYFSYQEGPPVLQDVSVRFEMGATAVIGQNGAGKTTLMKLLNGLLKPTEGDVFVGELSTRDYEAGQIAKHVGLVFQNPDDQIFKNRVLDEVMFGPLNIGMSEEDAHKHAMDALTEVDLSDKHDENPYDLSYAERKRICIASILAMQTDVVVFDEPTISQDVAGLRMVGRIVRKLAESGKTVIAIVHDMNFAAEYFDRIVAMAQGRVVADGPPEDVFANYEVLSKAHVDAPAMVKLSSALDMSCVNLTVGSFVSDYKSRIMRQ